MCDTIGDPTRCEGLIVVVLLFLLLLLLEEDVSMWSIFEFFEFKFFESLHEVETADFFCLIGDAYV